RADDAGQSFGRGGVHAKQFSVSVRGAHKLQVQHVAQLDVVDELAAPPQQAAVFLAWQAFADPVAVFASRAHRCFLLGAITPMPLANHRSISANSFCPAARANLRLPMRVFQISALHLATRLW